MDQSSEMEGEYCANVYIQYVIEIERVVLIRTQKFQCRINKIFLWRNLKVTYFFEISVLYRDHLLLVPYPVKQLAMRYRVMGVISILLIKF